MLLEEVREHLRSAQPSQRVPLLWKPHNLACLGASEPRHPHHLEAPALPTAKPATTQRADVSGYGVSCLGCGFPGEVPGAIERREFRV